MLKKIKLNNNLIVFFLINTLFFTIFLSFGNAQENYLLSSSDFSGQKLLRQSTIHWAIDSDEKVLMGIGQKWTSNENEQKTYIQYCVFNTEIDAFLGTAYAAVKSNAVPFIWGSFNGSLIADGSWMALSGRALYFVRGNIGVKLFKTKNFDENDVKLLSSISLKIAAKIESNLVPEVNANEEKAKQRQISITKFDEMTGSLKVLNSFSSDSVLDSKWIIDRDNYNLGRRKEWNSAEGLKVVIDICQFDAKQNAVTACEMRSKNTYLYDRIIDLEELNSLNAILNEWKEKCTQGLPNNSFSIVGIKGAKSVHVYFFNEMGIDTSLFRSLFEELSLRI